MAYGNWGAWVHRLVKAEPDARWEHMPAWEDATPYQETEQTAGYWQAFNRDGRVAELAGLPEGTKSDPHHAVLGDKRVRLYAHKTMPGLLVDGGKVPLTEFTTRWDAFDQRRITEEYWVPEWPGEDGMGLVVLDGQDGGPYRFAWEREEYPAAVRLTLIEPDGTLWTSHCGFCIGAGHQEDGEARPSAVLLSEESRLLGLQERSMTEDELKLRYDEAASGCLGPHLVPALRAELERRGLWSE